MSSSSALMVATFLALGGVNGLDRTEPYPPEHRPRRGLAEYLGCVENGQSFGRLAGEKGVGTFGGSEDHTAMLCCRAGHAQPVLVRPVGLRARHALPKGIAIVVGACGVEAVKTAAAMEAVQPRQPPRAAWLRGVQLPVRHQPPPPAELAVAAGPAALLDALSVLNRAEQGEPKYADMGLASRFEQFFREDQLVIPAAVEALRPGN